METASSVDEYIISFSGPVREKLEHMRELILKNAPDATETISYGMPAYKGKRILFYFAGFKNHVSFFPTASGIKAFESQLTSFKTSKGTVQFPLDLPLPEDLLIEMIRHRVEEESMKH